MKAISYLQKLSLQSLILLLIAFLMTIIVQVFNTYLVIGLNHEAGIKLEIASSIVFVAITIGSIFAFTMSFIVQSSYFLRSIKIALSSLTISLGILFIATNENFLDNSGLSIILILISFTLLRSSINIFTFSSRSLQVQINAVNRNQIPIITLITMAYSLGTIIAPVVGQLLFESGGLHLIILSAGLLAFFSLVITTNFFQNSYVKYEFKGTMKFFMPDKVAIKISIIASIGYILHAVIYTVVPLIATKRNNDFKSVKLFFTTMAITRLITPMITSSFLGFNKISSSMALSFSFLGLLLANIGLLNLQHYFNVVNLVILACTFGFSEAVLSVFTMTKLNNSTNDNNKLASNNGLYIFLTSSLGIGLGQLLGTASVEKFNVPHSMSILFLIAFSGIILIWIPIYKRKDIKK